jgi:hypothetical protein
LQAFAGLNGSVDGQFDPENPLSLGTDRHSTFGVMVGLGGSVYQEYTQYVPLDLGPLGELIFSSKNDDQTDKTTNDKK